jgi:predicted enzyme related to lactoylglutathione lyase
MSKVIRFEINVEDPERVAQFYREVFGWEVEERPGPVASWRITAGPEDEPGINGTIVQMPAADPGTWHFVEVPSVDEFLDKVVAAGGKVFATKRAISCEGWDAYVQDPAGNVFGLFERDESVE